MNLPISAKRTYIYDIYNLKLADKEMVEYISVTAFAANYGVPERTVRNYCANGKLEGAYLIGKTWNIPAQAVLPQKGRKRAVMPLLKIPREQKDDETFWGYLS